MDLQQPKNVKSLAENLQILASTYAQNSNIELSFDDAQGTSYTSFAEWINPQSSREGMKLTDSIKMALTDEIIPKQYRKITDVKDIFYKADIAHEVGHIRFSIPHVLAESQILQERSIPKELLMEISNIADDIWINWRLKIAYNTDSMARAFGLIREVFYKAWAANLEKAKDTSQIQLSCIWLYALSGIRSSKMQPQTWIVAQSVN